jgi:hypothetical protein
LHGSTVTGCGQGDACDFFIRSRSRAAAVADAGEDGEGGIEQGSVAFL